MLEHDCGNKSSSNIFTFTMHVKIYFLDFKIIIITL